MYCLFVDSAQITPFLKVSFKDNLNEIKQKLQSIHHKEFKSYTINLQNTAPYYKFFLS